MASTNSDKTDKPDKPVESYDEGLPKPPEPKKYMCSLCGRKFETNTALVWHNWNDHN
ncbi:hypothetical protein QBC38DRAFT_461082 [Podospora fimiseda]|uniref:C2H2-type domain-containing protein n=1 Tax=Podospora fimiseda TaxID=252190 RepID=A0AAN6YNV9_9PEZI|nr:hypothetical protein QBC38DRAFT_461082 [Podospora fimiseda]